jgi:hypothetical protein
MHRLVEAELLFQLLDELRIEPLRTPVPAGDLLAAARLLGLRRQVGTAGRAADARRGVYAGPLKLGQHLLDRAAGGGLHDDEVDHHDPDQRRDDQQQAADDVGQHPLRSLDLRLIQIQTAYLDACLPAAVHHVPGKPIEYRAFFSG